MPVEVIRQTGKQRQAIPLNISGREQTILYLLYFLEQTVVLTVHFGDAGQ
jgi:hypothetical protein